MSKLIIISVFITLLGCNPNKDLKHDVQVLKFEKAWLSGYKAGVTYGLNQDSVQSINMWIQDSIEFENYLKEHE